MPVAPQEIGGVVADFRLPDIHGNERSLADSLSGKKGGIVVFWSGVCAHCVHYDEYLSSFAAKHPELALIAVASRSGETPEQIRKTVAERKLTFLIVHDADRSMAKAWFTQQTPRAFLLDANRTLLYRGAIDNFKFPGDPQHAAYLEAAIAEFLEGKPVSREETASFGCAIQTVYYEIPVKL